MPTRGGERKLVFARLGCLLADEPALKELLGCKGHAGTKPCVLCLNVVQHSIPGSPDDSYHADSDYLVSIAELDFARCQHHSDQSLRLAYRRVHEAKGRDSASKFAQLEQAYGISWSPHSIVLNSRFNIAAASVVMYDWAHGYLCDGVGDAEFGACMAAMRSTPNQYKELAEYVGSWTLPNALGNLEHLFRKEATVQAIRNGGLQQHSF